MKAESIGKFCRGFSTVEILIAFTVIILVLAGATSVSFGTQSLLIDAELYLGAISRSEEVLSNTSVMLEKDFNSILSATSTVENLYQEEVSVLHITPCVKKVTVLEKWKQEGVLKDLYFSQIFTSPSFFKKILDTCDGDELFSQDWEEYVAQDFSVGVEHMTDIDIIDDFVFISSNSATTTDADLFVLNSEKSYEKISELDIGAGVFAIDATRDYVYVATNASSSQFAVIDVSDPYSPIKIAERDLFGIDPWGSYPQGWSIKYFDNRVYIGTKETAGPELHVFDVSNPHNPYQIGYIEVTHNINDIEARDSLVYLATSADTQELIVMDVNDPSGMFEAGYFNAGTSAVNDRDATSLYLLGQTIYLGRKRGALLNPEFYMVDVSTPSEPKKIGDFGLSLSGITSYVSGLFVSSDLVFVSTTDSSKGFLVLDVSDPNNIEKISTPSFTHPLSRLDFQNGVVYAADYLNGDIYEIQKNQ